MVSRRGLGKLVGRPDAQSFEILEKRSLKRLCELAKREGCCPTATDRLVVHVGQVHHPPDLIATELQMALQEILENVGAEISDVCKMIDRRAAGVEAHTPRLQWEKIFCLS